ncbi:MFS transporter [Actinomadura nitritigenes]|uniref:MFS transporter n=1 Tax=Actinomadura nitritigenes TaxID=134602 RepID=UPI003D89B68E
MKAEIMGNPPSVQPRASSPDRPRPGLSGPLGRLLLMFGPASFGISLVWGAVPSILLPLQVQDAVGETRKVAVLALVTACGAAISVIVQPIGGLLSDRTRSRLGRRTPWMLGGVLAGGLALAALSYAGTVAAFVLLWAAAQVGLNLAWSPLTAIMPDRVPPALRGTYASVWGLGAMLGALGGQVYGAAFAGHLTAAYLLLGVIAAATTGLLALLCPDGSSRDLPRSPAFSLPHLAAAFWIDPRRHPDFGWAFLSRMCAYTGYYLVFGYKLYILQDYIGLKERAVDAVATVGVVTVAGLAVSTLVAGRLSDRIGRRKPFVISAAVLVAGAVLVPLATPTLTGMLVLAALAGLGFGCFQAVDTALVSEVLPSAHGHAKDLGIVNLAGQIPAVLAPAVAGLVVLTGGYAAIFPIGAAAGLLSALALLPVKGVR